jgi:hypothetical protein
VRVHCGRWRRSGAASAARFSRSALAACGASSTEKGHGTRASGPTAARTWSRSSSVPGSPWPSLTSTGRIFPFRFCSRCPAALLLLAKSLSADFLYATPCQINSKGTTRVDLTMVCQFVYERVKQGDKLYRWRILLIG